MKNKNCGLICTLHHLVSVVNCKALFPQSSRLRRVDVTNITDCNYRLDFLMTLPDLAFFENLNFSFPFNQLRENKT